MKSKKHRIGIALIIIAAIAGVGFKLSHSQMTYGGPPAVVTNEIKPGPELMNAVAPPQAPKLSSSRTLTVRLDVVHRLQEVADGVKMMMWTFGGSVPGPTFRVRQGDKVKFIMTNRSTDTAQVTPPMPHSMDFHAGMLSPQDKYRAVGPGQTIEFEFVANYPGVFMYHCGTPMILHHLAMGMYGAVIVEPENGYPTKADREYVLVQSEFYPKDKTDKNGIAELDFDALLHKTPKYVAFNGKAFRHTTEPMKAKPRERVRLFVLNVGPNGTSSFHVVGTIFDRVWFEGNPVNEMRGMQTALLGASNSAIVEFVVPEAGKYVAVDHEFSDANAGAMAVIDASEPDPSTQASR
jgi:nitrite reductase (NO-forming)